MHKEGSPATAVPAEPPELHRHPFQLGRDPVRHVEPKLDGRSAPYRPDTALDGGTCHGMTVRAASVRGRMKRFQGGPRQDDFCLRVSDSRPAIVVAVADGMGSAKRSGLGAALAVRHAVEAVEEQLVDRAAPDLDWPSIFNRAAAALLVEHRRDTGTEQGERPNEEETRAVSRDLGTTLTVAIVETEGDRTVATLAAVGDSPAFRLAGDAYELLVGERETDEGFSTSAVIALPYLPVPEVRSVSLEPKDVLLVCTDGFSGPLSAGYSDVGRLFARELAAPPPLCSWLYLVDFAKATYDDDRTLVAIWPAPRATPVSSESATVGDQYKEQEEKTDGEERIAGSIEEGILEDEERAPVAAGTEDLGKEEREKPGDSTRTASDV
ncbi:MAG: protein phosphatase 2C domain-containing protein [Solirubrobacteraceae bacterium]